MVPHPPLERYYSNEGDRRDFVDRIFDNTAPHYDWINSLLSFGTGIRYRRDALERAGIQAGMRVLDVCTGSGQVARAAIEVVGTQGLVVGLDGSLGMVAEARKESFHPPGAELCGVSTDSRPTVRCSDNGLRVAPRCRPEDSSSRNTFEF